MPLKAIIKRPTVCATSILIMGPGFVTVGVMGQISLMGFAHMYCGAWNDLKYYIVVKIAVVNFA